MGYVGLPLALLFGDEGHVVTGFDIDVEKVQKLTAGDSSIARIGISEVQKARAQGFSAVFGDHGLFTGQPNGCDHHNMCTHSPERIPRT